jgi:hypothetical protein
LAYYSKVPKWNDEERACEQSVRSIFHEYSLNCLKPFKVNGSDNDDESVESIRIFNDSADVNKGWPQEARFVLPPPGVRHLQLKAQPSALRSIIKISIQKVLEDAIHLSAYPSTDTATAYFRNILSIQADKSKNPFYAKRFAEDLDFGNRVTPLVCPLQFFYSIWTNLLSSLIPDCQDSEEM